MEAMVCISIKRFTRIKFLCESIEGITLYLTHAVCCSWLKQLALHKQEIALLMDGLLIMSVDFILCL